MYQNNCITIETMELEPKIIKIKELTTHKKFLVGKKSNETKESQATNNKRAGLNTKYKEIN